MNHPSADDLLHAFLAQPENGPLGLAAADALLSEGFTEEAVAVLALADDVDPRVRRVKDAPNAPAEARAASARADRAFREHFSALHLQAIDDLASTTDADLGRVRNSVWTLTHNAPIRFRTELQKPMIFYMPDLPASTAVSNDRLPWVPSLESAWEEIRSEYESAVENRTEMSPYVPAHTRSPEWAKLRGNLDWSSIHLFQSAQRTPFADSFPRTVEALSEADLVKIDGTPLEVFFSRLKPGAHIPPHYGLTNTRLTTHLPLVVPDSCAIRVGEDVYEWHEGTIIAFDDSYQHEAWNRSSTDRVVLIFEVHHPDLSAEERAAIEHTYSVRQAWLDNRRRLLQDYLERVKHHKE